MLRKGQSINSGSFVCSKKGSCLLKIEGKCFSTDKCLGQVRPKKSIKNGSICHKGL